VVVLCCGFVFFVFWVLVVWFCCLGCWVWVSFWGGFVDLICSFGDSAFCLFWGVVFWVVFGWFLGGNLVFCVLGRVGIIWVLGWFGFVFGLVWAVCLFVVLGFGLRVLVFEGWLLTSGLWFSDFRFCCGFLGLIF